jgi:hypothetical protein
MFNETFFIQTVGLFEKVVCEIDVGIFRKCHVEQIFDLANKVCSFGLFQSHLNFNFKLRFFSWNKSFETFVEFLRIFKFSLI